MASPKHLTLITGANSGIGFEVANQLLADASNHVLLGARSVAKGEAAVKDLQARGLPGTIEFVQLDVASEESIAAAAKAVESKHGRLDALVNNAGIAIAEQMIWAFRVNAVGPELMGNYFEPLLRKAQGTPRIVNVTSGVGSIGNKVDPNGIGNASTQRKMIQYSASKAAMNMVSATQFVDFGKWGCRVFTYCPGFTVSNLSPFNTLEAGGKPTSEGAAPIIDMLNGERDNKAGKFLKHGMDSFPW